MVKEWGLEMMELSALGGRAIGVRVPARHAEYAKIPAHPRTSFYRARKESEGILKHE
jgi:hypothetical protein